MKRRPPGFATPRERPASPRACSTAIGRRVLHAMAACMVDAAAMTEREVMLLTVPMFHVNAWGMPYSCTIAGAKQVLPGPYMIGQPVAELIESERVTSAAGVPTIYNLLYQHLKEKSYDLSSLKTVMIGGAAASRTMVENYKRDFGITIVCAWGMTETSPMGTISRLKPAMESWPEERQMDVRLKAGRASAGRRGQSRGSRRAKSFPGTANPSASCWCAGPGSQVPITTIPLRAPRSPTTAGFAPVTW